MRGKEFNGLAVYINQKYEWPGPIANTERIVYFCHRLQSFQYPPFNILLSSDIPSSIQFLLKAGKSFFKSWKNLAIP